MRCGSSLHGDDSIYIYIYIHTYIHTYIHIHAFSQTCWGPVNGTCVAAPRFTEITPWGTTPGLELGTESRAAVLPAIYNHRMARINLTAYAFGGVDGKYDHTYMHAYICIHTYVKMPYKGN